MEITRASSESCHLMRGLLWRRALYCGVSFTFSLPHSLSNPLFPPLVQKEADTKPVDISLMRQCVLTIYILRMEIKKKWARATDTIRGLTTRIKRIVLYTVLVTINKFIYVQEPFPFTSTYYNDKSDCALRLATA